MGTVSGIDAENQSITVNFPDSAETSGSFDLEMTDSTEVLKNFMSMPFDSLKSDQDVRVELVKSGDKVVPKKVILLN